MSFNNLSALQMETCLAGKMEALTDVMGEVGLSRKILDDLGDMFRLDVLERIRSATTVQVVLSEMRQYLYDASVCSDGTTVLYRILKITETAFCDALVDVDKVSAVHKAHESFSRAVLAVKDGHELIFSCLMNHVSDKDTQKRVLLLLWVLVNGSPSDSKDLIQLLSSPRGVKAMLVSLDDHQSNESVQAEALGLLKDVGRLYSSRYGFAFPNADFYVSLAESGVIPSLFLSVQRHATNATVVANGCRLLGDIGFGMQALHPIVRQAFLEYRSAHPDWRRVVEATRDMHPNDLSVHDSVEFMLFATTALPRRGAVRP
jgi:hypothetical protein